MKSTGVATSRPGSIRNYSQASCAPRLNRCGSAASQPADSSNQLTFNPRRLAMMKTFMTPTRRELLATAAAVGALTVLPASLGAVAKNDSIRPFKANVPEKELTELRRRIAATRWPEKETVLDRSQGAQLAKV